MQIVVEAIEQAFAQIHVADRIDTLWEVHAAGHLAISMGPVVLDALHVPLVHEHDYFVALRLVNLPEKILVALINHDLFNLREENVSRLNVPVHFIGVEDFLSVGLRAGHSEDLAISNSFPRPLR